MSKNLPATRGSTSLADPSAAAKLFAEEANRVEGGGGGKAYLKLDGNTGDYSYGAENEELPAGSKMLLDVNTYARGWLCWVGGEVVEEVMVPMLDGQPPKKHQLTDHGPYEEDGDGWVEQMTIEMRMMDEPFTKMVFQANNASKRRAMGALMKDFARFFQKHPGEYPVIELDVSEFQAKMGKNSKRTTTKYAPSFKIVDWLSLEELAEIFPATDADADASEDDEDERPARKASKAAPAQDEDRPARRSSRRNDDDDEEDEHPARKSSRRDEDDAEEDERPARRSSRRDDDDEEEDERPARKSSRRDEDDAEEESKPRRRGRF